MAKNYTLEDVETLRSKSGVGYEEAVSLLDKYDGDVARALIELEKRGQLNQSSQNGKITTADVAGWIKTAWRKGMNTRVIIERKEEQLICLPILLLLLMLILGPYAFVAAFILTLVTGCSVSIKTEDAKTQTLFKSDDEPDEAAAEPEQTSEEAEETGDSDDDFPSITIS